MGCCNFSAFFALSQIQRMHTSIVCFVALLVASAKAQTFGDLRTCFETQFETCTPDCVKKSGISQPLLTKIRTCAGNERGALETAIETCAKTSGVTISPATPCWPPAFLNQTGPGRVPGPHVPRDPVVKAFHECMFPCVKNGDCFSKCTAAVPANKEILKNCHDQAANSTKPAFFECVKAGAPPV
jgi:hypothetical protein